MNTECNYMSIFLLPKIFKNPLKFHKFYLFSFQGDTKSFNELVRHNCINHLVVAKIPPSLLS